jgi:hypothetical protein
MNGMPALNVAKSVTGSSSQPSPNGMTNRGVMTLGSAAHAGRSSVMTETIDITPTWEAAVSIYVEVLTNSSNSDAVISAREDLLKLARFVDSLNEADQGIDPNQLTLTFD